MWPSDLVCTIDPEGPQESSYRCSIACIACCRTFLLLTFHSTDKANKLTCLGSLAELTEVHGPVEGEAPHIPGLLEDPRPQSLDYI